MALSWEESKRITREASDSGIVPFGTEPKEASSKEIIDISKMSTIELAEKTGYPILQQAPPEIKKEDTFLQKALRVVLPKSLEVRFGITEPDDYQIMQMNEDARANYLEKKRFDTVFRNTVTEPPKLKEGYIEPESFIGQWVEGLNLSARHTKSNLGYILSAFGRKSGSPELIKKGLKIGDKALIEIYKRPELLPPEDLDPFFEGGWADKRYWGRTLGGLSISVGSATVAAIAGAALAPALGISAATGGYIGGFGSSFLLEKGAAYTRYIDEGLPPDKADDYSTVYGAIAAYIEQAVGFSPAQTGTQLATQGFERVVYDSWKEFVKREIPKISFELLKTGISEGGEEVMQGIAENLILKFYKTEAPVFEKELIEEFAAGFAGGVAFGSLNIRLPKIVEITQQEMIVAEKAINRADTVLQQQETVKVQETAKGNYPADSYKKALLQEISNLEKLPVIDQEVDFIPPNVNNNPYTRVMGNVWDKFSKVAISKAPVILKIAETQEISNLLKERARVYDGLVSKYYTEIVKPISILSVQEKQQIGEMIFKRIDVPAEFQPTIKNIDASIGQLGEAIVNIDKDLINQGLLMNPEAKKRAGEIGSRLIEIRKELSSSLKALSVSMKGHKEVVNAINLVEKQLFNLDNTFTNEMTAFLNEGAVITKDVPKKRRLGTLPETLVPLAELVKKADKLDAAGKAKLTIDLEQAYVSGLLERNGFDSIEAFHEFLQSPYKVIPAYEIQKTLKANIKKLQQAAKLSDKLTIQLEILKNIDVISTSDALIFLESIINTLKEERGDLWQELKSLRAELSKPSPLLSEEVWMENLGEYARTLYVKVDESGNLVVKEKSNITPEGMIDRSSFKHKLTDAEWGANSLSIEGKTLAEIKTYSIEELNEIGAAAKEKYGWVFQGDYILAKTLQGMSQVYASRLFQKAIIENPRLFTTNPTLAKELGFVAVEDILPRNVKKDERLGPINNGYIHKGLVGEFKSMLSGETQSTMQRLFQEPLSWWKIFKVAANPATVIRNYISGSFLQTDMAGYPVWRPKNAKTYIDSVKSFFAQDETYKKWRDNGLYGSDYFSIEIETSELQRIIEKAEKSTDSAVSFADNLLVALKDKLQDGKNLFQYYGLIDHIARTYLAECAAKDGATIAQSVHFANKWQLDYRFVPKFVEYMRSGLPGWLYPFLSFHTLMAPRIAETLITRPWVLLKYPIIFAVANAVAASILGADEDDIEKAKPEYLQDKDYVITLPTRDENGDFQFISLDYMFPFGGPQEAFMEWDDVVLMAKTPGMMSTILAILNNYDTFTDRKIFNETDLPEDKKDKMTKYIIRNLGPGFVTNIMNIIDVANGKVSGFPVEREKTLAKEIAKSLGVSIQSGGFNEIYWSIKNTRDEIKNIKYAMANYMNDPKISMEEKSRKLRLFEEEMAIREEKIRQLTIALQSFKQGQGQQGEDSGGIIPFGQ